MNQTQTQSKPSYSVVPYVAIPALNLQPVENKPSTLEKFKAAISEIFIYGIDICTHERTTQDKATSALSKILGAVQDVYGKASILEKDELMAYLRQRCRADGMKKIDKRTTIFHLFSRQLRHSDRKQASSDAKILIRADEEGQTEQSFEAWVKKNGGLNNIKNDTREKVPPTRQPTEKTEKPKNTGKQTHERKFVATLIDNAIPGMFKHLTADKVYSAMVVHLSDGTIKIAVYDEIEQPNSNAGQFEENESQTASEDTASVETA